MANKDLFEQAIADAKKLKEISMANAKQVIEEAFAPKIQEMFRLKLSEMEDLKEDDYTEDGMEDDMMPEYAEHNPESEEEAHKLAEEDMEEATLDEILAELELEEGDGFSDKLPHDDITGTEKGWVGGEEDVKGTEKGYVKEAEEEEKEEETEETSEKDATEVSELSIEDFKNLIRDVVADVMGSQEAGEASEEGDLESTDEVPGDDETISLDEILAELQLENQEMEESQLTKEYTGDVGASVELGTYLLKNMPDIAKMIGNDAQQIGDTAVGLLSVALPTGAYALKKAVDAAKGWFKSKKKEVPVAENQLTREYTGDVGASIELGNHLLKNMPDIAKMIGSNAQQIGDTAVGLASVALPAGAYALGKLVTKAKEFLKGKKQGGSKGDVTAETAELNEAVETINYLKAQLSEVNLLNAKLLYVNKIFKAKSLTENQKVKVVSAFDRATTTKEAKNIYETLVDSLTSVAPSAKKTTIKESLGFASKPIGSAPATPIVEADAYVYRMQQLAGIKQPNI